MLLIALPLLLLHCNLVTELIYPTTDILVRLEALLMVKLSLLLCCAPSVVFVLLQQLCASRTAATLSVLARDYCTLALFCSSIRILLLPTFVILLLLLEAPVADMIQESGYLKDLAPTSSVVLLTTT